MFEKEIQGKLYELGASFSAAYIVYLNNLRQQTTNNYVVFRHQTKDLAIELEPNLSSSNVFTNFYEQILRERFSYGGVCYFDLGSSIVECHIINHCSSELRKKNKATADQKLKNFLVGFNLSRQIISKIFDILAEIAEEPILDVLCTICSHLMPQEFDDKPFFAIAVPPLTRLAQVCSVQDGHLSGRAIKLELNSVSSLHFIKNAQRVEIGAVIVQPVFKNSVMNPLPLLLPLPVPKDSTLHLPNHFKEKISCLQRRIFN